MSASFDAEPVLRSLTSFQRASVDHIIDRFYGDRPTSRFLCADETGLGKSLVARGVIAKVIERLQGDDSVDRIDIVYICSNADIAEQNLERLNVTGRKQVEFASRLTLLAKHAHQLAVESDGTAKAVNLLSFTPGTSFQRGHSGGKSEERSLLHFLLSDLLELGRADRRRADIVLAYTSSVDSFRRQLPAMVDHFDRNGEPDPGLVARFEREARRTGAIAAFEERLEAIGQRRSIARGSDEFRSCRAVISQLRSCLAKASVDTLEPDLVILDEFQRFRDLLDPEKGGEAAELAHDLFDYGSARTLLLSATPYKPFTYAEERLDGEDHHADFISTLTFLAGGDASKVRSISDDLSALRGAAARQEDPSGITARLRTRLLDLMCRTERPLRDGADMVTEALIPASSLSPKDVVDLAALRAIAAVCDAPFGFDYWKSAPYFVNFLQGYKIERSFKEGLSDPETADLLDDLVGHVQHLDRSAVAGGRPIELGNARLRALAADTVDRGWWKLLWLPPSLPYLAPDGPYADIDATATTKRLIFSTWSATPTAIAALLSHEAQRHTHAAAQRIAVRLDFRLDGSRPGAMTTLALFWPHPGLARACDPLEIAAAAGDGPIGREDALEGALDRLGRTQPINDGTWSGSAESWYWQTLFALAEAWPAGLPGDGALATEALSGSLATPDGDTEGHDEEPSRLSAHVRAARAATNARTIPGSEVPDDLGATLATIGMHGPGNIAWRALARQIRPSDQVSRSGHWIAAATIASGFRSLFNRTDVAALLDQEAPAPVYWRSVLAYCAAGNLQAVMDEYLHHLVKTYGDRVLDDDALLKIAGKVRDAISMRPAPYTAFDPRHPEDPIRFSARFALRYGNKQQNEGDVRQPAVRNAFNSPFWPFVLASTSVGQEGIDLHWWCHAVVHWNTPSNPVDFDQREGRVHRYGGHAIRKNIAAAHASDMLSVGVRDPWEAGYAAGESGREELGDLCPHWVFPGPAKVTRMALPYPLSVDSSRIERLKDDVALYRLTLGQPRQEDLLDLLRRQGVGTDAAQADALRLDLSPPNRAARSQ